MVVGVGVELKRHRVQPPTIPPPTLTGGGSGGGAGTGEAESCGDGTQGITISCSICCWFCSILFKTTDAQF